MKQLTCFHVKEKSTIGDGHADSKFANELGALHKYEISYIYNKYIPKYKNVNNDRN